MPEFVKLAAVPRLADGQCCVVKAGTRDVALYRTGGKWFALDNTCIHRGGPLGEGSLEGETVTCPWHGWEYDVKTGQCLTAPGASVKSYPVKAEGPDLFVQI